MINMVLIKNLEIGRVRPLEGLFMPEIVDEYWSNQVPNYTKKKGGDR